MNENRFMRVIVMFDLPVETKIQQKAYRKFHKELLLNGFLMLQYSIYVRFCNNDTAAVKFMKRISKIKPIEGNIRMLKISEIQFENMVVLLGDTSSRENLERKNNLIIID